MSTYFKTAAVLWIAGFLTAGCIVYVPAGSQQDAPPPVVEEPVVTGPGVVLIDVEPPPEERVYVYDPGFPPGVYFYGDYYWYNGYRYPRDVFVDRYVAVNVRENRFIDVEENRRMGQRIEVQHRQDYAANRGIHRGQTPAIHREPERRARQ
jgi:hypothetical protein